MSTKALPDLQEIQVYVLDIARQAGLRARPPILIREVILDGAGSDPDAGEHLISLGSKGGGIETRIPRGDPKDPEWRFLTRARVEDAVSLLASRLN